MKIEDLPSVTNLLGALSDVGSDPGVPKNGFLQVTSPGKLGRELLASDLLKQQIGHLDAKSGTEDYQSLARKCAGAARALYEELDRAD